MSAITFHVIVCDICGRRSTPEPILGTAHNVRRFIRRWGWHYQRQPAWVRKYGGQDICGPCYDEHDHTPGRKPSRQPETAPVP